MRKVNLSFGNINVPLIDDRQLGELKIVTLSNKNSDGIPQRYRHYLNPEKPDVPLNKNDAFQKVQKRRVQEKR